MPNSRCATDSKKIKNICLRYKFYIIILGFSLFLIVLSVCLTFQGTHNSYRIVLSNVAMSLASILILSVFVNLVQRQLHLKEILQRVDHTIQLCLRRTDNIELNELAKLLNHAKPKLNNFCIRYNFHDAPEKEAADSNVYYVDELRTYNFDNDDYEYIMFADKGATYIAIVEDYEECKRLFACMPCFMDIFVCSENDIHKTCLDSFSLYAIANNEEKICEKVIVDDHEEIKKIFSYYGREVDCPSTIKIVKYTLPTRVDSFRESRKYTLNKLDKRFYWISDRPTELKQLEIDYRNFSLKNEIKIVNFVRGVQYNISESNSHLLYHSNILVLEGNGFIMHWS